MEVLEDLSDLFLVSLSQLARECHCDRDVHVPRPIGVIEEGHALIGNPENLPWDCHL